MLFCIGTTSITALQPKVTNAKQSISMIGSRFLAPHRSRLHASPEGVEEGESSGLGHHNRMLSEDRNWAGFYAGAR